MEQNSNLCNEKTNDANTQINDHTKNIQETNSFQQKGQPYYGSYYQHPYYPQKKKRKLWPWITAAVVVLIFIVVGCSVLASRDNGSAPAFAGEPSVACIYVEGTISSTYNGEYDHQFLLDAIDSLIWDENNAALMIYLDTPGGEVLACDELSQKIDEYKQLTQRPVYAYGHNTMASAGYWIASTANRIYAHRFCTTGSIGVTYGSLLDVSVLLDRYGIKVNTISSGEQKSMGSYLEPMKDSTRAIFQSMIDEYYGYFLDWIVEHRPIDKEELIPLADGRVYTATQALNNGLIDEVGTFEEAVGDLMDYLGYDYPLVDYLPEDAGSIWDDLGWLQYLEYDGNDINSLLQYCYNYGPLAIYGGGF